LTTDCVSRWCWMRELGAEWMDLSTFSGRLQRPLGMVSVPHGACAAFVVSAGGLLDKDDAVMAVAGLPVAATALRREVVATAVVAVVMAAATRLLVLLIIT